MKTNSLNAKKMLMSTLAAVAFSFVFTTGGNASTIGSIGGASQYEASKCELQKASSDSNQEKQKAQNFWEALTRLLPVHVS